MNKHILLGLLLVPCFARAMEQERVERYEDETRIMYWRGKLNGNFQKVVFNKKDGSCYSNEEGSTGHGDGSSKGGKSVTFLILEEAYIKQQAADNQGK